MPAGLAAESQIQPIRFPKPSRRRTGAGALWPCTKLHFTSPSRRAESGSDRNTLLVLPLAPALGREPRRPGTPSPGREEEPEPGRGAAVPAGSEGAEPGFITTINSFTMQGSSRGKGGEKAPSPRCRKAPCFPGRLSKGSSPSAVPHSGESNLCANIVIYLLAPPLTAGHTLAASETERRATARRRKRGGCAGGKVRGGQIQVQC
ncbi:uncharacterized protein LOC128851259 [Cuculus canorus]|uniref:uncharacterized protein LOC128851259 n=1 Tax=Cuculus canorus TaxID=55661 RepID=UPI0023AA6E67|nr:uncharacterized protein LOC128851259 [Cuculus canorus]